jgi:hypothetical protein
VRTCLVCINRFKNEIITRPAQILGELGGRLGTQIFYKPVSKNISSNSFKTVSSVYKHYGGPNHPQVFYAANPKFERLIAFMEI